MKRALIVASGLRGIFGHNFFYTQMVERELEKRGFEVTVFINKNAPTDLLQETGYKAVFSLGTYDSIPSNGKFPDLIYTYLQSRIYAYDLQAAINQLDHKDFDFIFFHTLVDFELIGINRYLSKNKFDGHLFIMQRQSPKFDSISKWKTFMHPYLRIKPHYLKAINRKLKSRFTLLTDSEILSDDYALVYPHRVVTAPIPLNEPFFQPIEADNSEKSLLKRHDLEKKEFIDFGYMGDFRGGKGFDLLPSMIKEVIHARKDSIRFLIQCANSEFGNDVPLEVVELQELAKNYPNRVVLINERLSDADYLRLFEFLDVIMIPYTAVAWEKGTSNILTEAIALGKPAIVSNNTWMSHELKKYGGGLEFEKKSTNDFAEKVIQLTDSHHNFAKKVAEYSPIWREKHNVRNLVDLLLREGKLS